jgi:hypothetical protein
MWNLGNRKSFLLPLRRLINYLTRNAFRFYDVAFWRSWWIVGNLKAMLPLLNRIYRWPFRSTSGSQEYPRSGHSVVRGILPAPLDR